MVGDKVLWKAWIVDCVRKVKGRTGQQQRDFCQVIRGM